MPELVGRPAGAIVVHDGMARNLVDPGRQPATVTHTVEAGADVQANLLKDVVRRAAISHLANDEALQRPVELLVDVFMVTFHR